MPAGTNPNKETDEGRVQVRVTTPKYQIQIGKTRQRMACQYYDKGGKWKLSTAGTFQKFRNLFIGSMAF
jgi:hypothetical protein